MFYHINPHAARRNHPPPSAAMEWSHLLVHDVICSEHLPFRHCQGVMGVHSAFLSLVTLTSMVIVWRVRGKIIRSVLCNIMLNNCAQCNNAHTYEQT